MEYCSLKGFLVVLLIQHCTSEGLSSSIQSSTVVTNQEGQTLPQESELTPAEVAPVVAPPSLKEVQQAVQEASEQVEGRGAEEVLKELLERVVEAAMGQVEGGGEVKADEAAEQGGVPGDGTGENTTDPKEEEIQQAEEVEDKGEDTKPKGEDKGVEEEKEVAEVDAAEEVKEAVEGEVETAGGSEEEVAAGVETEGREGGMVEAIHESLDTEVIQEVVEETAAVDLEKRLEDEAGGEDNDEHVELSEEKRAAEANIQKVEEAPDGEEVPGGVEPEQESEVESEPGLAVSDVEQLGDIWEKNEALEEESLVPKMEDELIIPTSNEYEIETTQNGVGQPIEQDDEINVVTGSEGPRVEDEQGQLEVTGRAVEEVETKETSVGETEGGETHGESVVMEQSVANEGLGEQQAGEEEQIAFETSHSSEKEDQEVLVISAPEPEHGVDTSIEQSPENHAPTTRPSLGGAEAQENAVGEKSSHGNEIITPTGDLLPHDPVVVQPTLDNLVKDVLAEPPQAEGEEPGEANELVEGTAGSTETSELGLEAWKIGAISAAAFLVLETVVIFIYILKCRKKNSTMAQQRACEEGCVEPEAATGGDCSDDTLPAGNGDPQQIAAHDPSDVASPLAQNKGQNEEEHGIAMSDLLPSSAEESSNTGPGPDTSQDPRTSVL